MKTRLFVALSVVYVVLIVLANWLASRFTITVPFTGGLIAPAGVLCIGAVLVCRDWGQQLAASIQTDRDEARRETSATWRRTGLGYMIPLMLVAGASSYLIGVAAGWTSLQKIAIASVVAFLVSETVEAVIFTPIRNRSLTAGVALSATVANAIDSYIFLAIAFGSQAFFWGNFWGKLEMIVVGVIVTALRRYFLPVAATA